MPGDYKWAVKRNCLCAPRRYPGHACPPRETFELPNTSGIIRGIDAAKGTTEGR